ncbi:MAG: MBL fold metallo-hydrolase [Chelatococcus sp.]|nr:MBL fold metallo-hydrolase [Chelatococcus sp. HY11]MBX3547101.1 MBL fold metallo-hydrolase [Chelatococcus sp.]
MLPADGFIETGSRRWEIMTGPGRHSPEPVMLYDQENGVLIAGDQILPGGTPHLGATPEDPTATPARHYAACLDRLEEKVRPDALVLPGHGLPFRGLDHQIAQARAYMARRRGQISALCKSQPMGIRALAEAVFRSKIRGSLIFTVADILACVNQLSEEGLIALCDADGGLMALARPQK